MKRSLEKEVLSMKVSVIIPTCNRVNTLAECLRSLERQICPRERYEIIVADDSTTGAVRDSLESLFPDVKFIEGPRRGPAANRNSGAKAASGDLLLFVDDDCLCSDRLIESYLRSASADLGCNVFEGKTVPIGSPQSHADECPANLSGGYLWSCNFAIRKDLYVAVGGFDEAFRFPAMEDVDLRYRLVARGEKIVFIPDAKVSHPWESRFGWERIRKHRLSQMIYLKKHPEELEALTPLKLMGSSTKSLLRQTVKGFPQYRLKKVSQRFRNLAGDLYLLAMRRSIRKHRTSRILHLVPQSWRLQD